MSLASPTPGGATLHWTLTLYVNGASPQSAGAIRVVRGICDGELAGRVDLTIHDVSVPPLPDLSHIIALPTLVKQQPDPVRYLVGDLSDLQRVRDGLDLGTAS